VLGPALQTGVLARNGVRLARPPLKSIVTPIVNYVSNETPEFRSLPCHGTLMLPFRVK